MSARNDSTEVQEQEDSVRGLSPNLARQRLGALLRDARTHAGLTLEEAGQALDRSAATISRLERAEVKPRLLDVSALLDHYAGRSAAAVPEDVRHLAVALTTESRRESWFSPFRDVLAGNMVSDHVRRYVESEQDATRIDSYQMDLVPGLLQTEAYARAIADTYYADRSPEQRERFVQFRMKRQEVLTREAAPPHLHVVLGALVFRRNVGGPAVMREQLTSLADRIRNARPNITIQAVPAEVAIRAALGGPFLVMSFADSQHDFVYLEMRSGAEYSQRPSDLEQYRELFSDLSAAALDPAGSLNAIETAIKELPS
ncbi:helix-turn-helix domain-containing protein [Pseudonocardia lacus]|uniref:helix-turn-helix domain-containing protein n=1 Tax=Pseudonocardia lacus TaxID=2835865 RepID=UPI001BDC11E5|nr:helix-turn-helix transcriptional regulator [Pseudonocardia lacus]